MPLTLRGQPGLEEFDETSRYRKGLYQRYVSNLTNVPHVQIVNDFDPRKEHAAWLFTILVEQRIECQKRLRSERIESGQTHYRNDRYAVFGCDEEFPAMDAIDDKYLILPLHTHMNLDDVDRICALLKEGW